MRFTSAILGVRSEEGPTEADVRRARVARARRHNRWTEIPAGRLVRRNRLWLVDAETDEYFVPVRGVVFHTGTANILADHVALHFVVGDDAELVFYEIQPGTWSDRVARQVAKEHARAARMRPRARR